MATSSKVLREKQMDNRCFGIKPMLACLYQQNLQMKAMSLNYTSSYKRCLLSKAKMDLDIQSSLSKYPDKNTQFTIAAGSNIPETS